jgi:hypothetical protein
VRRTAVSENEARVLDLLVRAHRVEAQLGDQLDLAAQRVGGGRRQVRGGPVALAEHRAQHHRAVVHQQVALRGADAAQAQVAGDDVPGAAGHGDRDPRVQQHRCARPPQQVLVALPVALARQRDGDHHLALVAVAVDHRDGGPAERAALVGDGDLDGRGDGAAQRDPRGGGAVGDVAGPPQALDVHRVDRLQPDRLPDARGAVVPDRVRGVLPLLLAARLREVLRVVLRPDHHHVRGVGAGAPHHVGDVHGERGVPALVLADQCAVHPHPRAVVHGAQVQQQPAARGVTGGGEVGGGEVPAVPDDGVEAGVADPGVGGLGRERHGDRPRQRPAVVPALGLPGVEVVVREAPGAAEVVVALAEQLRTQALPVLRARPQGEGRGPVGHGRSPSVSSVRGLRPRTGSSSIRAS